MKKKEAHGKFYGAMGDTKRHMMVQGWLYDFLNSAWMSTAITTVWSQFDGAVGLVYWGIIDGLIQWTFELGL